MPYDPIHRAGIKEFTMNNKSFTRCQALIGTGTNAASDSRKSNSIDLLLSRAFYLAIVRCSMRAFSAIRFSSGLAAET